MAVYNGGQFLAAALESVLRQSMSNFEFIIVDDASNDETPALLAAAKDPRILIVQNDRNLGLTASLNIGLRAASGKYIARIDADDICLPDRLARQFAFMERNHDHVAIGCGYNVIDDADRTVRTVSHELDDWQVNWVNGFYPPAAHPTYIFRRTQRNGDAVSYDESYKTAQDFDLWSRLARQGKMRVLPDVLLWYRRHPQATTELKRRGQVANSSKTGIANLQHRLPRGTIEQLTPLIALFAYEKRANPDIIQAAVAGCNAMLAHDLKSAPTVRHRRWVRRMAAGLLADAILSRGGGLQDASSAAAFFYHARTYLPSLMMAVLSDPKLALKSVRNTGRF
jgi:glycosyltransferase involved in cell wall biosynthesis